MSVRSGTLFFPWSCLVDLKHCGQGHTFTTIYSNNNLWSQSGGTNGHVQADLNGDGREDSISQIDGYFNGGCTGSFAIALRPVTALTTHLFATPFPTLRSLWEFDLLRNYRACGLCACSVFLARFCS
jgi:hypothetical protein